jgi:hypothetical protein
MDYSLEYGEKCEETLALDDKIVFHRDLDGISSSAQRY